MTDPDILNIIGGKNKKPKVKKPKVKKPKK